MSLRSGVPREFKRVRGYAHRGRAEKEATRLRRKGLKARVISDPHNDVWVLFKGPKRSRKPQARWAGQASS